jgi:hypothetical protein
LERKALTGREFRRKQAPKMSLCSRLAVSDGRPCRQNFD